MKLKMKCRSRRRKAKAAMNRHQGRLHVPGSNPKNDMNEKVFLEIAWELNSIS